MGGHVAKLVAVVGVVGSVGLVSAGIALADPHDHDFHDHGWHGRDFHGRDFRHFTPEERNFWRGGRWLHSWHDGRFGWWWDVGGIWYYYPQPIYPYPTYVPAPIVAETAPPAPPQPAYNEPPPQQQAWYYCDNPRGYYPYVQSCSAPWRPVPAAPPSGSGPAAPPGYGPPPQ